MKRFKKFILPAVAIITSMTSCQTTPVTDGDYNNYPAYKGDDLEMTVDENGTQFTLWSPTADSAMIRIYNDGIEGEAIETRYMERKDQQNPWRATFEDALYGKFYTFSIFHNGEWLAETPGAYARAVGVNGKRAAIIDMATTNPEGWENDVRPALDKFTDIIIYEMHHRDFSIHASAGNQYGGKFLALTQEGTRSPEGEMTGIDHLKELGITHVHILPSYDYGSVDESRPDSAQYNWGYDPVNYNTPEGSYSTNAFDPATRIREMKQMVQALHKNGIRVILDVVYNHTYINDGSNFSLTTPGYYYRHKEDGSYADASACNNETASEREMVRNYIVNSVLYWANEYHFDGFRFDLMGIHDIETMKAVRAELDKIDPTIFIYGEGWAAQAPVIPGEQCAMKANAYKMPGVAVFSDDLRDGVKGHFSQATGRGFATGAQACEESVKFGIVGAIQHPQINYELVNYSKAPYTNHPTQVINYVSCHDDMCLTDKLRASMPDADEKALQRYARLAQTIVFTSQGVPFMFTGEEIFRDKKGVHNSYCSPDEINAIDWSLKHSNREQFDYYRNLIQLRKSHPAFRLATAEEVCKHLQFIENTPEQVVAYTLNDNAGGDEWNQIVVAFNGSDQSAEIEIPEGNWMIIANDGSIDLTGSNKLEGSKATIAASAALILAR
ncbi:MAG: type I pullulanase [Bacteroidaceae bacterium]|nr:type I pullulanase [Bacteroidaceae bacterium]